MISCDVQLYYRHLMHPNLYGPAEPTTENLRPSPFCRTASHGDYGGEVPTLGGTWYLVPWSGV